MVDVRILDPHVHGVTRGHSFALSHDDGTVAVHELGAVIADAKPNAEAESAAEPVGRLADVGIGQDGYDGGRGNGAVRDRHRQPSAGRYPTSCRTQVFPSGSLKSANDA